MFADLHRHLDGSLRPETVRDFATASGVTIPARAHFENGMGLEAALALFRFTLSLLQSPARVEQVAREMCEDATRDRVSALEIRFAPQLHSEGDVRPAALGRILDAALAGIDGRAGLILCGLYGESPDVLEALVEAAAPRPGVLGIDLAGGPHSSHAFALADYAAPFARAARLGLGRTVHAGEGRPPDEIAVAIERLGAQRIGHGTTILDDRAVVALAVKRGITLEACPTSNVHTGVIAGVAEHPLPRWLEAGLRVCVCTDNTFFSQVTSSEEHARVRAIPGMDDARLRVVIEHGHAARFRRA